MALRQRTLPAQCPFLFRLDCGTALRRKRLRGVKPGLRRPVRAKIMPPNGLGLHGDDLSALCFLQGSP